MTADGDVHRSGFATLVGRPNVGKSTLLNAILGRKVSIVSDKAQTTRMQVRGVLTRPGHQLVFVDTPGIHKPVTALGRRLNETAADAIGDVDLTCLVVDARAGIGRGDRYVADRVPADAVVVVNKIDGLRPERVVEQLALAAQLGEGREQAWEYFPVSARTGQGIDALVEHLLSRLPEGPAYYPEDVVGDTPEAVWVAELVREQLLGILREELPHSIAARVTEWEGDPPRIRCEIHVERESQKGIVIGRGGAVLKQVGIAVREQLPPGSHLELFVRVDRDWQRRPESIRRLGY